MLYVAVGGALGSISRYTLGKFISERSTMRFPMGTFVVNILGAFLLGIVSNIGFDQSYYALLGDGFLGAFTTFSTFMYEGFNLFGDREFYNAFTYIILSALIGIFFYNLGAYLCAAGLLTLM